MHKNIENGKKYLPISILLYIIIGSPNGGPILLFSGGDPYDPQLEPNDISGIWYHFA